MSKADQHAPISGNPSVKTGLNWWKLRWQLLHGGKSGPFRVENLPEGILIRSAEISQKDIVSILGLGRQTLPEELIKHDRKRSIYRVRFGSRSFVLKKYHYLHRWPLVSPDRKGWLGAHRLNNDVACHAWYRRLDLSHAIIICDDAGDRDLYMTECLQSPPERLCELFRQAGEIIARLHRKNIFHADTKPGNFVYSGNSKFPALKLIDTDDVRNYIHLSNRRKARNLAQFIGCTRPEFREAYLPALLAFLNEYMRQIPASPAEMLQLFPVIQKSLAVLYPEREALNRQLSAQLLEHFRTIPENEGDPASPH